MTNEKDQNNQDDESTSSQEIKIKVKGLALARQKIFDALSRFTNVVNAFSNPSQIGQLQVRLEQLQSLWAEFVGVQGDLELFDITVDHSQYRVDFEDKFFESSGLAKTIIDQHLRDLQKQNISHISQITTQHTQSTSVQNHTSLPKIKLPEFYGSYELWLQFADTYKSIIHNSTTLSNIEKFWYLKSCLKGDAAKLLLSLEVIDSNYEVAWDILCNRYENKRVIIQAHMKSFFDMQQIHKESHVLLRTMIDNSNQHLRALKSLGLPVDHWDCFIIFHITSRLDPATRREWEDFSLKLAADTPTANDLFSFLNKRCQVLENVNSLNSNTKKCEVKNPNRSSNLSVTVPTCLNCKKDHFIFSCGDFLKLSTQDRINKIRNLKACTNCLKPGHSGKECRSHFTCKKCSSKHNTLLHLSKTSSPNQHTLNTNPNTDTTPIQDSSTEIQSPGSKVLSVTNGSSSAETRCILLPTACVLVQDKHGNHRMCRALLDSGSQLNFISKSLFNQLGLPSANIKHSVEGFGNSVTNIHKSTNISIKSTINSFSMENIECLIIDRITRNLPDLSFNVSNLQIPKNINLADEHFNQNGPIDLLIGASIFWNLLSVGQIKLQNHNAVIQKTKLGWIISGSLLINSSLNSSVCNLSINTNTLHNQLEAFWKIEEYQPKQLLSQEEQECETHFLETTTRNESGIFVVSLPFKSNMSNLGTSYENALKRFYSLEKKLTANPLLKTKYTDFIKEYIDLNHMSLVPQQSNHTNIEFYLPHHAVFKESSTTTKLRVVFDGSAKTSSGLSLNDTLKVGAKTQDDLIDIVIRFRTYKYGFTADIEKMYRSVLIQENQRCFQKILWRFNPAEPLTEYQLNTVTYGTASAAHLAIRCLQQVAVENQVQLPHACDKILSSFYVDDWLCGSDTIQEGKTLIKEVDQILKSAGFNLRKWVASDNQILENISNSVSGQKILAEDDTTKTLGITWKSKEDLFQYKISLPDINPVTKRSILAITAQIFDPMGLVGPTIIKAKIILQKLWQLGLDWDESIPMDLHHTWTSFCEQISSINEIKIPRLLLCINYNSVEFHGFSDASQMAYGACCYLKSYNNSGDIVVRLICAKSRVAPLKTLSVPRLELCGAVLLARLSLKVLEAMKHINIINSYFWTDSSIILSWLALEPSQLNTFVVNRISDIKQITSLNQWHHVPSSQNPADIISRGIDPDKLKECKLWWFGPDFLKYDKQQWPNLLSIPTTIPEIKQKCQTVLTVFKHDLTFIDNFSSFSRLQRTIAFCLRFFYNSRTTEKAVRFSGSLSKQELNNATIALCKVVQNHYFADEIKCLKTMSNPKRKGKLIRLNPFIDPDGLLRVGGRLKFSELDFNGKHPILIPSNSHFTTLIVRYEHLRHLHSGAQTTLSAIRANFWPINGRHTVQKVIRNCVVCFRSNPIPIQNQMGELPKHRVTPQKPFFATGIDFAGPFLVKDGKTKNRVMVKCYLCIFVCFTTKAAHFELAADLSSESFLNCLKRFISRRGICANLYSDNGTNFVGAERDLKETIKKLTHSDNFKEFLDINQIKWHFSPPYGPNFGGLWEACVKSAKFHLKRIVGNAHMTYESLLTVFIQIEAVLNSRPLVPLSSDPNDLSVLTPGHFLIGQPLTAIPQTELINMPDNRLTMYQRIQQQVQHFWRRWSQGYLNTLQERSKWDTLFPSINVGTLVIIKDDNVAPLFWKLGRVTKCFPGKDGVVRVVDIQTNHGVCRRAISKICALPIEDN